MSSIQPDVTSMSLGLSEVLSEIGVNDEIIMKRREGKLLVETTGNVCYRMPNSNIKLYCFGSQSEGSTTIGIHSDEDGLMCIENFHVIQDWAEWKSGVKNLLMVQDETTAPGYCLLQLLRDDEPVAASWVPDDTFHKDAKGRVLLKNTSFCAMYEHWGLIRHGPAASLSEDRIFHDTDVVFAFQSKQWPLQGARWLTRRSVSGWPSALLKSESEMSGCFVVPVGSKISGLDEIEWRISTSMAERYLMFSLNITQMRCYVLMKMLLKSDPVFKDVISSYMCKTALFHCIENTTADLWHERNLVVCFNQVLRVLYTFIANKNCPHFIIAENNLMADRISTEQQRRLLEAIQYIICSDGKVLFQIRIDDVGMRLGMKFNRSLIHSHQISSPAVIRRHISGEICHNSAQSFFNTTKEIFIENNNCHILDAIRNLLCYYTRCSQQYSQSSVLVQMVYHYMVQLMCSTIGTLLASYYISVQKPISDIVFKWLKLGLNSDVSSGWLKLATVCYSGGDMHTTEEILRHINQHYDRNNVMPVCNCTVDVLRVTIERFGHVADQIQIRDIRHTISYCVVFMRSEINVVPQEMRQEYYRSTQEDICSGRLLIDRWMDLAEVDSLPYLYFLQYKTYGRLGKLAEQQTALNKLQQVTRDKQILYHAETALNLLGQCLEQENLPNDAFHCYEKSLQVRPRNNAANFHMSRLLAK